MEQKQRWVDIGACCVDNIRALGQAALIRHPGTKTWPCLSHSPRGLRQPPRLQGCGPGSQGSGNPGQGLSSRAWAGFTDPREPVSGNQVEDKGLNQAEWQGKGDEYKRKSHESPERWDLSS